MSTTTAVGRPSFHSDSPRELPEPPGVARDSIDLDKVEAGYESGVLEA